jgi:hypothetical protein
MSEGKMTLYDLNKQLIAQMEVLDQDGYANAKSTIRKLFLETEQTYYMLLCSELNYYTVFQINRLFDWAAEFDDEVINCVEDIGAPKSIELVPGAVEIWVHQVCGDPVVMYLFPYDAGVIECTL